MTYDVAAETSADTAPAAAAGAVAGGHTAAFNASNCRRRLSSSAPNTLPSWLSASKPLATAAALVGAGGRGAAEAGGGDASA